MASISEQMQSLRDATLTRIEKHLAKHPMGEKYFGRKAAGYPGLIENLRNGAEVGSSALEKANAFIDNREVKLRARTPAE